jgi:hypothetical protein
VSAFPAYQTATSALSPRRYPVDVNRRIAEEMGDEDAASILRTISARMDTKRAEMSRFQDLCNRFDNLYYPDVVNQFGADHWPDDPNLAIPGRVHLSVNVYPVYVDVPASLQSYPPIENIVAANPRDEANRELASAVERVYFAWKEETDFETLSHMAATTKALYGRTAAKVWWSEEDDRPAVSIIDQPRHLWLGWGSTDYLRLDWAAYSYRIHPLTAAEEYGLALDINNDGMPVMRNRYGGGSLSFDLTTNRDWLTGDDAYMVEVLDYWWREPVEEPEPGRRTRMQTCNAVLVGNHLVHKEVFPEYDGRLPFVPVFNTFIPGVPDGRSELFDVEQLIREKDERMSNGGTMVAKSVGGQFWQLTGAEAPDSVPVGLEPKPDKVVAPGAGNRIEKIEPWMPQFQLDDYLSRIDRELSDVSGLNDLLRGLAPAQVLSSGKAINALVANYEARISMRRKLFYRWRSQVWDLAVRVWGNKNPEVKAAFEAASRLIVTPPSLTPRDELETATMAANNVNSKLWALRRGMDAVGVEDPEAEVDMVKEERTDASLFPADVQTQAALASQLQQLQMTQMQMQGPQQAQTPPGDPLQALAAQAAQAAPGGQPMMNGAGEQAVMPPEALTPGAPPPGGGAPVAGEGFNAASQQMIKGGEPTNRLLFQQPIGPPPVPPNEVP